MPADRLMSELAEFGLKEFCGICLISRFTLIFLVMVKYELPGSFTVMMKM